MNKTQDNSAQAVNEQEIGSKVTPHTHLKVTNRMQYLIWTLGVIGICGGCMQDHDSNSLPGLAIAGATLILVYTLKTCTDRIITALKSCNPNE